MSLLKPEIEPMQDSDWKEDGSCHQETPQHMAEAVEDVRQPCGKAQECNDFCHLISLIVSVD